MLVAKEILQPLSMFQSQIKNCNLDFNQLKSLKNYSQLYTEIQKKYLLVSEKIIYRELFFRTQDENRKIKITNNAIELFKIDKDQRHIPINIDMRHRPKVLQAQINQLILNAKIENDWQKTLEIHENGLKIEIVRVDEKITQLKVMSNKNRKTLDCQIVQESEVCLCNK